VTEERPVQINCPLPIDKGEIIRLGHGSGGRLSQQLLQSVFLPAFKNETLSQCQDAAILSFEHNKIVVTTDSYVVNPIFFPGGNIGSLSVYGTVNDICMRGAEPLFITVAFIIEEGFLLGELKEIVEAMAKAAQDCQIKIIAGDTKVVNRGAADKLFINTTGIGRLFNETAPGVERAMPGDDIIVSGDLGRHAMTIMCARNNFELESKLKSDSAPLNQVVQQLMSAKFEIHCLRDITRGGLATCLNELAQGSNISMEIDEISIPISDQVQGACEILGLDPFFLACEGRFVCIAPPEQSNQILNAIQQYEVGRNASVIGKIVEGKGGRVNLKTRIGGKRSLEMLTGEQLPRIC